MSELQTLYLPRSAVEAANLPMTKIIELVEFALTEKAHGRVEMPAKHWMESSSKRWFGGMSSLIPAIGYSAMKWQSGGSDNASRNLPYITGMLFLNNVENGLVDAVMDSTWITQQRTAAESAVTVKYLAKANSSSYAMLGCGVQARSHLEAFKLVMPHLSEVVLYDIRPEAAAAFAKEVEAQGLRAIVKDNARAAVEATDIVVTAGVIEPDVERAIVPEWLRAGQLGITLDYDCYWTPAAFEAADLLLTDDFGQVEHVKEYGYFVNCLSPEVELGSVVAGLHPGRRGDDELIIVINMGVAVEDVVTAKAVYEIAKSNGLGIGLPY